MTYEETFATITRLADDLARRGFTKLPAERELAERLNVSRSSIRRALAELEEKGVVHRKRGRTGGAYLTAAESAPDTTFSDEVDPAEGRRVERPLGTVVGVPQMLRSQGFESGTRLLSASYEHPTAEEREYFGLGPDDLIAAIVRIRFADGDSLSLESFRVSATRFPQLLERSLIGSLYELLVEHYGVRPATADEQIRVVSASPRVAAALAVEVGTPLLKVNRNSYDGFGAPVEMSVDYFRADRTVLHVPAQPGNGQEPGAHRLQHRLDTAADAQRGIAADA
ncbi:GntR family transcriptional regulator [Gordonia paraffinivorans]|uniref:GntR family transcriptional regulator n=1 Tax=Gordonia paraffinivorans TaxID=175628 RepID=UPI000D61A842|nr:GntR family transcriptional regulator [Gordonia paraffinivorans]MCD2147351.1 GntR family transcriptional regulator [Gordonia paraffinivorans]PWD44670.1 GntR family transcriptional regulator [Gordonia paraffinivorans]